MNYTFKLSRRLARFRAAVPIAATILTISCAEDPSGPASDPSAGPSSITISPESVSVGLNQAVQFGASTDGSSVLAFSRSGKGRGRKTVVSVAVAPQSMTVSAGASNRFSATTKLSDGSNGSPPLSWTATGGTIDQTGLYTAGTTAGSYQVIAAATDGIADTAAVTVAVVAPVAAQLVMTPTNDTLAEGATAQFAATGKASDGTTVGVSPLFVATGGSVTSAGVYTAGQTAGTYRVIATDQVSGLADTSGVTITPTPAVLQSIALSPTTVTLASSATQQFTASGKMSDSSASPVAVTWSGSGGTISSAGLYTAGSVAGSYRVIATQAGGGLADTSAVTITVSSPTLQSVVLTPASVTLQSGATQQYAVSGRMSDGSTTTVNATYSATGGTITSGGLYTAGASAGAFRVVATQQGGTKADTSSVTITTPAPPSGSCARTVNVSTASGLSSALTDALPGDCIVMAAGSYSSGYTITRSGTQQSPITLTGPRTAIIGQASGANGLRLNGASYWVLKGFRVSGSAGGGIFQTGGNFVVYDSLEVDHTGGVGFAIRVLETAATATATVMTGTEIRNSYIHDTSPSYGEGIYVGSSYGNQPTRHTYIHHNTIANTGSEAIELKVKADSSRVEFNTITNGKQGALVVRSNANQVNDNIMVGTGSSASGCGPNYLVCNDNDIGDPLQKATGNWFHRNTGSNQGFMFINGDGAGTDFRVYCDNVAAASTVLGTTCTP